MPSKKPKRKVVRGVKVKIKPVLRKEPDLNALAEAALILGAELYEKQQRGKDRDKAA